MRQELSRAHRWFPLIAVFLTLALFAYSLGSPAYLDEEARLERDTLAPASALDGRLSFSREDAAGYWARQYGVERFLKEVYGSDELYVYVAPLPAAVDSLLVGLFGVSLPLLRLLQMLLHAAVGVLLFRLVRRRSSGNGAAFVAGLIFILQIGRASCRERV